LHFAIKLEVPSGNKQHRILKKSRV